MAYKIASVSRQIKVGCHNERTLMEKGLGTQVTNYLTMIIVYLNNISVHTRHSVTDCTAVSSIVYCISQGRLLKICK